MIDEQWSWAVKAMDQKGLFAKITGNGSEYQLDCPWCSDNKQHLYFNVVKGVFTCFRCNEGGRAFKLLNKLGINTTSKVPIRPKVKPKVQRVWPKHGRIDPDSQADRYLKQRRHLVDEDLELWGLRVGMDFWNDYVVWPIQLRDQKEIGLHLRRYRLTGQRALNYPAGIDKPLLGSHLIDAVEPKEIVIVEGPYDAAHVTRELMPEGMLGLALMGHSINTLQCAQLAELGLPVTIMLDPDAIDAACLMASTVKRWAPRVTVAKLTRGDPDEHTKTELLEAVGR